MSWRQESTFKASSKLTDEEREFLKVVKKLRDIFKLEEKVEGGEQLDNTQQQKLDTKGSLVKDITQLAAKLPETTELLDKNPDIVALLPSNLLKAAERKRQEEVQRRQRKEEREEREKKVVKHQTWHERPVTNLCVSDDGSFLFTCGKDKMVLAWDLRDQKGTSSKEGGPARRLEACRTFAGHDGAIWGLGHSQQKLYSGGADGKVLFWPTADLARSAPGSEGSVVSHCGSMDHGGIVRVITGCPEDLAAGAGGAHFATASDKFGSTPPCVATWSVAGRGATNILRIDKIPARANAVKWLGGSKVKLLTGHDNGYLGVWAADTGDLMKTLKLHEKAIVYLCLSAEGSVAFTASLDKSSKCVDVTKPAMPTLTTFTANRPVNAVAVPRNYKPEGSEDNWVVLAGGMEDRDVTTGKTHDDEFDCLLLGQDNKQWGAGKGHFGTVHGLEFLPDGKSFASCAEDGHVYVFWGDGSVRFADRVVES